MKNFQDWQASSYLSGGNASYIEELYETYLVKPDAVAPEWRQYFQSLPKVNGGPGDVSHAEIRDYFAHLVKQPRAISAPVVVSADAQLENKQARVDRLIDAYRRYGHMVAKIDPLGSSRPGVAPLELSFYDLSAADYETKFRASDLMGTETSTLQEIVKKLQQVYCNTIGFEYTYINDLEERKWLQQRIEGPRPVLSAEEKRLILRELTEADGLEKYLGSRYVGQKRFSLEGGDTLIPVLQKIVRTGSALGLKNILMGMAHRGRLNVLVNVIGKSPEELFQEFEGKKDYGLTSGDVKYHNGFSADVKTPTGSIHLSLAFNPSHLEIVAPVATGSVRARQDRRDDIAHATVMPVIMHGDAAFAGQGVVMETFSMSQTRGYGVGGSLHIVINNQVGFTTSNPHDARSSIYCTDIAKMISAPVFHVNSDDPESAIFLAQLAVEYRNQFKKDVVIDLVCYRRLGHNEADEPAATQPLMYQKIKSTPVTREIYAKKLIAEKVINESDLEKMFDTYRAELDKGQQIVPLVQGVQSDERQANWSAYFTDDWNTVVNTAISPEELKLLADKLSNQFPKDFELQRQVAHLVTTRSKMYTGEQLLDWGSAEVMAYGSLLIEGYPVRLTGQDVRRGTFAHRHAVFHDQKTGSSFSPLENLTDKQAKFEIYDSLLSEEAVLAFEYGYSSTDPKALVLWEAQFGDFANGAQVVIDQFISSGWQKWKRLSGLTMLLPHGYEGQGPEHSSARLERYLQLCAENNMQVCVPSTPAQTFHMLRRQILRPFRRPLIVMTPKSLLRHKLAVSPLEDLVTGKFHLVIPEIDSIKPADVRRVVLCSGKVYYDLLTKRRENNIKDIALVRIEQLYPFPHDELVAELERYSRVKDIVWCQEEPKNQGAWYSTQHHLIACLQKGQELRYVGRTASASPAAGYMALHTRQQNALVDEALKI